MTENSNENSLISDDTLESAISDIFTTLTKDQKDKKRMTFYLYWLFGYPIKSCAKLSGYSESYGYNLVHHYKKSSKLRTQVDELLSAFPERYKAVCRLKLPQIANVEARALDEFENDPKLAIRQPALLRQIKAAAGVIFQDEAAAPAAPTVSIKQMQVFWQQVLGDDKPEEAEIIDTK